MYTKEQLLTSSHMSKMLASKGRYIKGVLTSTEQQELLDRSRNFTVIANQEVFWFSDDYCMGIDLPQEFVPSSTQCPCRVVPRDELPSGLITTVEEYIRIFESNRRQITSIEELVDYLNNKFVK